MTSEVIRGLLPSRDVVDALLISVQPPMRRPMPVLAYPQQDLAPLKQGLNAYEADPEKAFPTRRRSNCTFARSTMRNSWSTTAWTASS